MTATLLTISQTKQINAAAALLRASAREAFLYDVTAQLGRFPSDADVTVAICSVIGVEPYLGVQTEGGRSWPVRTDTTATIPTTNF